MTNEFTLMIINYLLLGLIWFFIFTIAIGIIVGLTFIINGQSNQAVEVGRSNCRGCGKKLITIQICEKCCEVVSHTT